MFCSNCGSKIEEEGAIFCPNCGKRMDIENESQDFNGADYAHTEADTSSQKLSNVRPHMNAAKQKNKIIVKKPLLKKH